MSNDNRATIDWRGDVPASSTFDDTYYSVDNGLEQNRHNFLKHNFLTERWAKHNSSQDFCIAETGFGTGLNFLMSWQLWQQNEQQGELHFISVEQFPLSASELQRAHSPWAELSTFSQALLSHYPSVLNPGLHTIQCAAKVYLHLVFDEAHAALERIKTTCHPAFASHNRMVDAWYLDGFTPQNNPEMWRKEILTSVADLSKAGATFATFTVDSQVHSDLQSLGFECRKASGFSAEEELMHGHFQVAHAAKLQQQEQQLQGQAEAFNSPYPAPWYIPNKAPVVKTAIVVGGGLAGCLSAYALSQKGIVVTLLEQNSELASAGSGNPQGVIYGKLSHREESLSQYNLLALQFAQNFYRPLIEEGHIEGDLCGLMQFSLSDKLKSNHQKLMAYLQDNHAQSEWCQHLSAAELSQLAGIELEHPGLYFPKLGWLNPRSLCLYLIKQGNIKLMLGQKVGLLSQQDNGWQVQTEQQALHADAVVIACAHVAKQFEQTQELALKPVRGQITLAASQQTPLKTVLCGEGYIAPAHNQSHCLGASFRPNNESTELSDQEQAENLALLNRDMPKIYQALGGDAKLANMPINGRAAVRATTPDYLPLVGTVPINDQMQQRFALLSKNAKSNISQTGCYYPNLYCACGFGSRGISYAPLAAAHLANMISGSAPVLERRLAQQLNPARFLIRQLIRKS